MQRRIVAIYFPRLVAEADAEGLERTLASHAESALGFGPTVAFCARTRVVWVDITGCAHLHASSKDPRGEASLATAITQFFFELDEPVSLAITHGPELSSMLARFGQSPCIRVENGEERAALSSLPVQALPLSTEHHDWLMGMGLRTIAEVRRVPRGALAMRLGLGATLIFELIEGVDRSSLRPHTPPEVMSESVELDEPLVSTEALGFVLRKPLTQLMRRVRARDKSLLHLTLELVLEARGKHARIELSCPSPVAQSEDLFGLLRLRLEPMQLTAPILAFTLTATKLAQAERRTAHMFEPVAKAEAVLPRLVAELAEEIGESNLGRLCVVDSWRLTERSALQPLDAARATSPQFISPLNATREPARLLPSPIVLDADPERTMHLLRLEAIEWWVHRTRGPIDLIAGWLARPRALAHIEKHAFSGHLWLRGWMT